MTQEFVRKGKAVVNSDLAAYHAAKKRRDTEKEREQDRLNLEQRINRLEEAFINLEKTILACKREEQQ